MLPVFLPLFHSGIFFFLASFPVYAGVTSAVSPHSLLLKNGNKIPRIAFGTFGKADLIDKEVTPAVIQAIEAGYRHINTAVAYKNEKQIGDAIADVISRGIVTREELFITTKVGALVGTQKAVVPAVQESLKRLNLDYVDLYLIHYPDNYFELADHDYVNIWKGMEDAKRLKLACYIGVSNFNSTHINRILAHTEMVPSANEIEVNPTFTNLELVAYCQSLNMTVLSYTPFGHMVPRPFSLHAVNSTFDEPILKRLSQKYGKMPTQVVLRYLIDRGVIPMPKSTKMNNIRSNIDVFDFRLSPEEVYMMNELDTGVKVWYFGKAPAVAYTEYFHL